MEISKEKQKAKINDTIMIVSNFCSWVESEKYGDAICKQKNIPKEHIDKFIESLKEIVNFLRDKSNKSLPKYLKDLM